MVAVCGKRPGLVRAIVQCDRVLVIARVSMKYAPTFINARQVCLEQLVVFPDGRPSFFAILVSRVHELWFVFFASTFGSADAPRYSPSDCFETFPFPNNWETDATLEAAGDAYYSYRAQLLINNNQGLTTTYNRFHDPQETEPALLHLRDLHSQMDQAVLTAYGWHDIDTTCEFILDYEEEEDTTSKRKKPYRYRWPQATHDEVLARLLDLNQKRYEQEIIGGTSKGGKKKREERKKKAIRSNTSKISIPQADKQIELIPEAILQRRGYANEQLDVWSTIEPSET